MISRDNQLAIAAVVEPSVEYYVLKLNDGMEFAEFEPGNWRLTIFHVLGVTRQVTLGHAEVFLLECFANKPGEMLSRQQLIDHAWGDRVVSQGSLNQAISNLRALLGDDHKRQVIITVPRYGYQMNPDALMSRDIWLERKGEIISPNPAPVPEAPLIEPSESSPVGLETVVAHGQTWQVSALWGLATVLSILLMTGMYQRYLYAVWPPYAVVHDNMENLNFTVLAKDQQELEDTQQLLLPVFKRMAVLGEGQVLVNRAHNYLEFNCLRKDSTLHTLLLDIRKAQSVETQYLVECLK